MGQKNAVNVTYLVTSGTIDETLQEVIAGKRQVAADLSRPVVADVLAKWDAGLEAGKGAPAKSKGLGI